MWSGVFAYFLVLAVVPPAHDDAGARALNGVLAVSSPRHGAVPVAREASNAEARSSGPGPPGKPGKLMMRREVRTFAGLAGLSDDGQALLQEQQVLEGVPDSGGESQSPPMSVSEVPLGLQGFPGPPGPAGKAGPPGKALEYTSKGASSEALVAATVLLQLILVLAIYFGVKKKVAALIPDSALEDAKQVLKAAEKSKPPETYLVVGTTDPDKYDGTYRLWKDIPPDKNKSGYPIWKRDDTTDYIFSTTKGTWLIGDDDEEATLFSCNTGNFGTAQKHNGAWPHEVSIKGWMFYNPDDEEWAPCPALTITVGAP